MSITRTHLTTLVPGYLRVHVGYNNVESSNPEQGSVSGDFNRNLQNPEEQKH
jgi:hypothetical protein